MQNISAKVEEQTGPTPQSYEQQEVAPIESQPENSNEEYIERYKQLIKQQQEQIEQLVKQQELNQKVNKQLGEVMQQQQTMVEQMTNNSTNTNSHGVDKIIDENFEFSSKYDYGASNVPSDQLAVGMMKYMKEKEGCTNEQIESRMERMIKFMKTGQQENQVPFRKDLHEIKNEVKR